MDVEYGQSRAGKKLTYKLFGKKGKLTLVLFAMHANERSTYPVGKLFEGYVSSHPELWTDRRVAIITLANPDGWAKGTRGNGAGVDLNRNFPVGWEPSLKGNYYSGRKPLSEPESKALADLVEKLSPDQVISVHQPFGEVNYDGEISLPLAKAMAAKNRYPLKGENHKPTPGSFGKFCLSKNIPIVTLEMANDGVEKCWNRHREALVAAVTF